VIPKLSKDIKDEETEPKVVEYIKNYKQYSEFMPDEVMHELRFIASEYRDVKNYVYSRYSGINSLLVIKDSRKNIRDVWIKTKFSEQWNLQSRYWKQALGEAITSIKSLWSNAKNNVRKLIMKNKNLTKQERHYCFYIIKSDQLLHKIFNYKPFDIPEAINYPDLRLKYLNNLLRRLFRKSKGKTPYQNKHRSFMLDADMYEYRDNAIYIMGRTTHKRIRIPVKDKRIFKGNIRIVLQRNIVEIHSAETLPVEQIWEEEKQVGLDKGYIKMISTSEEKYYGVGLNKLIAKESDYLNDLNKKRNKLYALAKKYKAEGNLEKANNIYKNNLGKKKFNNKKSKFDGQIKTYINTELNKFFKQDKPSEFSQENLNFISNDKNISKKMKRRFSFWMKGYLRKRLEYKALVYNVKESKINAAYTSQVCHLCNKFGDRQGETFTCIEHGKMDADYNASCNAKNRMDDKEITLYMTKEQVKKILEDRSGTKQQKKVKKIKKVKEKKTKKIKTKI